MSSANNIQERSTIVDAPADSDNSSRPSFNIEIELNVLEESIFNSTNIPLTELAIIDRDLLLHQLNRIKENLPTDLATAIEIAHSRQKIIEEAQNYACLVVKSAEEKAERLLQESAIVRQAELDGAKIRLKAERECEELKQATQAEIKQLRQNAIAESMAMQIDADNYADGVLSDVERRLQQMLEIIQNGRQQLKQE